MATLRDLSLASRFLRAGFVGMSTPVLLRLPLDRLESVVGVRRMPSGPDPQDPVEVVHGVDAALAFLRPLARRGCLTTGITRYDALRRAGVDVTLWFGVGQVSLDLVAHCWLELDGQPVFERTDPRAVYTKTYCVPVASVGHA